MKTLVSFALALGLACFAVGCSSGEEGTAGCPAGQRLCDGACVSTESDDANCGACGNGCPPDSACQAGSCLPLGACDEGREACGGRCVDVREDPAHCGACDRPCAAEERCVDGACLRPCGEGESACEGSCVDLRSDPRHCGDCGESCLDAQQCVEGACRCPGEAALCGERCVDVATDPAHCGACGAPCVAGPGARSATCAGGSCHQECLSSLLDCDGDPLNGCEVDGAGNPDHCGACGQRCEADELCLNGSCIPLCAGALLACSGTCVDPSEDDSHCGRCDQPCPTGHTCSERVCHAPCAEGERRCEGQCVNPEEDEAHCGACGVRCEGGENVLSGSCSGGTCELVCAPGWTDCDGDPATGCEADLQVDPTNCGACGTVCPGLCVDGACSEAGGYAGWDMSCALLADGGLKCWGANQYGRLGVGDAELASTAVPTPVRDPDDPANAELKGVKRVALSYIGIHACALLQPDGEVVCWGRNSPGGRLGDGTTTHRDHPVWVLEEAAQGGRQRLQGAAEICIGASHSCALLEDRTMKCWGSNGSGQLGTGGSAGSTAAVHVRDENGVGPLAGVQQIACGAYGTCAVLEGGVLACWGSNEDELLGRPGDGSRLPEKLPLSDVKQVSVGEMHVCALLGDGSVVCWGKNGFGRLGDGTTQASLTPVAVQGVSDARRISAAGTHSCALLSDGTARCWGFNGGGKLGNGTDGGPGPVAVADPTKPDPSNPGAYLPLDDLIGISAGEQHTCATRRDGSILCWGSNGSGQLGDGTTTTRFLPGLVKW